MNTINTQDLEVSEMINSYSVVYVGERTKDAWKYDKWLITLNGVDFEYSTGIGHRLEVEKGKYSLSAKQKRFVKELKECTKLNKVLFTIEDRSLYAVAPTQASVLYCILMGSDADEYSFSDWCDNLGYDEDSRKALDIYLACQENSKKLKQVFKTFTNERIEKLRETLEDY